MTLDQWLSKLYQADIKDGLAPVLADFKAAIGADADLEAAACAKLAEIDNMIAARGRQACAYSAKYSDFMHEVFDAGS